MSVCASVIANSKIIFFSASRTKKSTVILRRMKNISDSVGVKLDHLLQKNIL